MYLYIYDSFLSEQKYARILTGIERRVTDLGIQGKITRLTVLKNIRELVSDAVKNGIKTIIAIGDDQTFIKIINVIATTNNVTLGLIPVTTNSNIARVLGIPPKELACDVIAARIVRKLDLGKINNYFFLDEARITNARVQLNCNGYSIAPTTEFNSVRLCNIGSHSTSHAGRTSNPTDGILEAIITPIENRFMSKKTLAPTVLPFTKISITSAEEETSIVTDDQVILKTPADVEVAPEKLKVIVGSKRMFE